MKIFIKVQRILVLFIMLLMISSCELIDTFISDFTGSYEDEDEFTNKTNIERIEVEYLIDNASSVITYIDPPPNTPAVDNFTGIEFGTTVTSIAGNSVYWEDSKEYVTNFDNPEVLGQLIRGTMIVKFFNDPR